LQKQRPVMLKLGPARLVARFSSSLTNRDWSNRMKQQFHQRSAHGTDEVEGVRPANPDETRCASASVIRRASHKHYLLKVAVKLEQNPLAGATPGQGVH